MARYVDADEPMIRLNNLAATLSEHKDEFLQVMYAATVLEKLPTADVAPVVRCKDCKRCAKRRTKRGNLMYFCSLIGGNIDAAYQVTPGHYCSYGVKMDEVTK